MAVMMARLDVVEFYDSYFFCLRFVFAVLQFTREEFQQNYQRLVREHLELERSYSLLQATHGVAFTDPQREDRVSEE